MDEPLPRRVDVKLGFACNNRCRFCVQGDKRSRYSNLTTVQAMRRLERARKRADEVVLTGGEVTIRRDLVRLVAHARSLGFRTIQIQTNGRMLAYDKLCLELVRAGATEFSPALHGHVAGLHDYLTRVEGSFGQTVAGIRNLVSLGVAVITNTVITRSNFRHLSEMARLFVELGVSQYQFAFVHALGSAAENFASIVPRMALLSPYVREGLQVGRLAGIEARTEAIPPCILPGYEEHMAEWVLPDATIFDATTVLESYRTYRLDEGKLKGPKCRLCGWYRWCEGVWREYVEHYGWGEFEPVCDPEASSRIRALARREPTIASRMDFGSVKTG